MKAKKKIRRELKKRIKRGLNLVAKDLDYFELGTLRYTCEFMTMLKLLK
jgi:hypothetical protein